jgi:hypothetical protein
MKHLLCFAWLFIFQQAAQSQKLNYQLPKEFKSGEEIVVSISIPCKDLQGIARFQQEFPKGFEVSELKNDGSIISFSNSLLQFLWIQLPLKDSLNISYKLRCLPGFGGKTEVPARLFYLKGSVREELVFNSMQLVVSGEATKKFQVVKLDKTTEASAVKPVAKSSSTSITEKPTPAKSPNSQAKSAKPQDDKAAKPSTVQVPKNSAVNTSPTKEVASPTKEATVVSDKIVAKETKPIPGQTKPITEGAATGDKISFRIQLAASAEKGSLSDLSSKFGVPEKEIREESHNGLFKYTTGEFNSLAEARKSMSANPKMKQGAFVAGYNKGSRIDLEEAIRLSKKP